MKETTLLAADQFAVESNVIYSMYSNTARGPTSPGAINPLDYLGEMVLW